MKKRSQRRGRQRPGQFQSRKLRRTPGTNQIVDINNPLFAGVLAAIASQRRVSRIGK